MNISSKIKGNKIVCQIYRKYGICGFVERHVLGRKIGFQFLEAHYELAELATTKDAEMVNLDFFHKVTGLYAASRALLEVRIEYLTNHPNEAFGKDFHFNEKGEFTHSSSVPPVHSVNDSNDHEHTMPDHSQSEGQSKEDQTTPRRPIHRRELIPKKPRKPANEIPIAFDDSHEDEFKFSPEHSTGPKQLNATFNLKLEPIKIPMFDGEKENWVLFRDQFLALVHNNECMNDAIKMYQLFTHFTPAGSNYVISHIQHLRY